MVGRVASGGLAAGASGPPRLGVFPDNAAGRFRVSAKKLTALQAQADAAVVEMIRARWPGPSMNATACAAGRALGVHPSTVRRWLEGDASPPGRVVFALMAFTMMEGGR